MQHHLGLLQVEPLWAGDGPGSHIPLAGVLVVVAQVQLQGVQPLLLPLVQPVEHARQVVRQVGAAAHKLLVVLQLVLEEVDACAQLLEARQRHLHLGDEHTLHRWGKPAAVVLVGGQGGVLGRAPMDLAQAPCLGEGGGGGGGGGGGCVVRQGGRGAPVDARVQVGRWYGHRHRHRGSGVSILELHEGRSVGHAGGLVLPQGLVTCGGRGGGRLVTCGGRGGGRLLVCGRTLGQRG